jgi:fumarylpyruvate hydrolase
LQIVFANGRERLRRLNTERQSAGAAFLAAAIALPAPCFDLPVIRRNAMSEFVFPPAARASLAVAGQSARFPLRRVFCIGRNYWRPGEAILKGAERELPFYFMKPADAVIMATGTLAYPPQTNDFCHEIELVVAIGKDGSDISPHDAFEHVWGYAAGMDLTRREIQMRAKEQGRPWESAKAFDGSAPTSALQPVARVGHPAKGAIWLTVNGKERQRADLSDQIWPVQDIVSFLSRLVRLNAGDLIFTGTPAGVDALEPGDIVHGGIEGIGEFTVTAGER